jgi:hypothetical protein
VLELGRLRRVVSRRSSGGFVLEMMEDLPNHFWVGDERQDSELPAALTEEGVFLENPLDEIGPSSSERGAMARREVGLAG